MCRLCEVASSPWEQWSQCWLRAMCRNYRGPVSWLAAAEDFGVIWASCHSLRLLLAQDMINRRELLMDPHARAIKQSHVLNIHGTADETVRSMSLPCEREAPWPVLLSGTCQLRCSDP